MLKGCSAVDSLLLLKGCCRCMAMNKRALHVQEPIAKFHFWGVARWGDNQCSTSATSQPAAVALVLLQKRSPSVADSVGGYNVVASGRCSRYSSIARCSALSATSPLSAPLQGPISLICSCMLTIHSVLTRKMGDRQQTLLTVLHTPADSTCATAAQKLSSAAGHRMLACPAQGLCACTF